MSRKIKPLAILAIILPIAAYIAYKALTGLPDALSDNDDIWNGLD